MKKFINKIAHTAKSAVTRVKTAAANSMSAVLAFNRRAVCGNAGEGYIDTAVKVLIAVVLGALVLAGLYAILNDTVMPTVTQKITEMFSYLRTENFQQAVEENVRYLHPPVQEVFQRFLMRIKHIDPDMDAALVDLKAAIDNEVWREWCDAVMACQTDRSLTKTPCQ